MAEPNIKMTFELDGYDVDVKTTRFHPKSETPKSYGKSIVLMSRPHGDYETGIVKIFKLKDGTYRAGTYVDGCFHMQYAKLEFVDDKFDRIMNARKDEIEYFRTHNLTINERKDMRKSIANKYGLIRG